MEGEDGMEYGGDKDSDREGGELLWKGIKRNILM